MDTECGRFPVGTRLRAICEGVADLPLSKMNIYRKRWGMEPLSGPTEYIDPVPHQTVQTHRKVMHHVTEQLQQKTVARVRKSSGNCKSCGGKRSKVYNKTVSRQPAKVKPKGLGDHVEQALTAVGITSERVEKWLGRPCNCKKRKEKLNRLGAWAMRIVRGDTENAEEYLEDMIDDG